jgi:hypothetical protein
MDTPSKENTWQCEFPEFEFIRLLFAILVNRSPEVPQELKTDGFDWDRVLNLIENHRLWGIATRYVNERKQDFPASFVQRLNDRFRKKSLQNLQLISNLLAIAAALDSDGIRYIALKGPFLSQLYYGSLNVRFSHDLDLLIKKEDLGKMDILLKGMGFELVHAIPAIKYRDYYFLAGKHVEYLNRQSGILIEVHVRIAENTCGIRDTLEELERHTRLAEIGGRKIRIFEDAFLLFYLTYHGSNHCWQRLFWLADILVLKRCLNDEQLEKSLCLMKEQGGLKRYEMALALAVPGPCIQNGVQHVGVLLQEGNRSLLVFGYTGDLVIPAVRFLLPGRSQSENQAMRAFGVLSQPLRFRTD